MKKELLLLLTDHWNDWEASYVIAVANSFSDYTVKTIGIDSVGKVSMGGIKAKVDFSINDYKNFSHLAMVILPGGLSLEENDYDEIAVFLNKVRRFEVPISAICGASYFLCKHGFLNEVKHTGDSLEQFKNIPEYTGEEFYIPAQVVVDKGIITANETAAIEFAYDIFKLLKVDSDEEIERWYDNFSKGAIR